MLIMASLRLVLVFASLLIHCTFAQKIGDWKVLPTPFGMELFSKSSNSFNVNVNLNICARREIVIAPGKPDYAAIFDKTLKSLSRQGGGTMRLLPGVYEHSRQINVPSYTCIKGAGKGLTTLRVASGSPKFAKSGAIRCQESERVTIMDLTQDGNQHKQKISKSNNYGRYGFFSELCNFLYLRNVLVRNNYGYGFDPHGSKKYWGYYLVIQNCESEYNGLDGFTIDQSYYASILNCHARKNGRHGFNVVTGTKFCLIKSCLATDNGAKTRVGYGFVAQNNQNYGTRHIRFENVLARRNTRGGFNLKGAKDVEIRNSRIDGPGNSICFEISRSQNILLNGNACYTRRSRKFKLGVGASYKEINDKSSLRGGAAVPKSAVTPKGPDPTCATGLRGKIACCPKICKTCGGKGCGARAKGSVCCEASITLKYKNCKIHGPPCAL